MDHLGLHMLDLAFTALLDFLAKIRGKGTESAETPCDEFVANIPPSAAKDADDASDPYAPGECKRQDRNDTR